MAKSDKGMIDLGKTYDPKGAMVIKEDSAPKTSYPTLFINDVKGLDNLPDGKFKFTGIGQLVSYKEDLKNGTCSCEIEVQSIKPEDSKPSDAGEGLGEALDKVAADKEDAADEADPMEEYD